MIFEKDKNKESSTRKEKREARQESTLEQEIIAGEWMKLCKYKAYKRRSRQGRILAVYQALSNRLDQLVKVFYELAREDRSLKAAEKMLKEINHLREVRERLLFWLTWNENDIQPQLPDEVEEIIS